MTPESPTATGLSPDRLRQFATRYIWWKTPDEAMAQPQRVIAQVMNIGDFDDARLLQLEAGPEVLTEVLRRAEAGQLNARSWHYWHYRLGLSEPGKVPPMPVRSFG